MSVNILLQLRSNLEFLSNTEKKIAALILQDPQRFITYSLNELSELANVSHGSIINFSKKYAGGGFPALKLNIASSLHTDDAPLSLADPGDSIKDVLTKNIRSQTKSFETTSVLNKEATLQQVAERIIHAKRIEIYGVYRSAVVATDLYYQLLQLGFSVSFISDILTCAVSASMLSKNDLVIAISASGKTQEIINVVKNARKHGASVVSLTSNISSPLARLSDDVLLAVSSGVSISGSSTEIRSSQLLMIDTLCSYLLGKMDDADRSRYLELTAILKSHSVDD